MRSNVPTRPRGCDVSAGDGPDALGYAKLMFGIDLIDASLAPAIFVALLAGVISFLSPCVLPIVPPYLAFMSGVSLSEMQAR